MCVCACTCARSVFTVALPRPGSLLMSNHQSSERKHATFQKLLPKVALLTLNLCLSSFYCLLNCCVTIFSSKSYFSGSLGRTRDASVKNCYSVWAVNAVTPVAASDWSDTSAVSGSDPAPDQSPFHPWLCFSLSLCLFVFPSRQEATSAAACSLLSPCVNHPLPLSEARPITGQGPHARPRGANTRLLPRGETIYRQKDTIKKKTKLFP